MPPYSVPYTSDMPVVPLLPLERLDKSALSGIRNSPEQHAAEKPVDNMLTLPPPLDDRIGPRLPAHESPLGPVPETIRGQERTVDAVSEILDMPLPFARGAVADGVVEPKLMESPAGADGDFDMFGGSSSPEKPKQADAAAQQADPLGYGMLGVITAIMAFMLVYMAFVAFDYQQRWMQSLTAQNDRYIVGGAFDMELENTYGGSVPLSEGFGLTHRSI